jgi:hypothetical protein
LRATCLSAPAVAWKVDMARRGSHVRRVLGSAALSLAVVFVLWLPLGVLGMVPFVFEIPGDSHLRVHTAAAVLCLLVAAWGFWEIDPRD